MIFILLFPDAARAQSERRPPKIALVLSGGAALGFAHIGFLKVMEEAGIPVDMVVGNSMGSLIGAMYAAGYSPGDIQALALEVNWAQTLLNEGVDRSAGLFEGEKPLFTLGFDRKGIGGRRGILPDQNITLLLSRLLFRVSMKERLADLPLPFRAYSVNLSTGLGRPLDAGPAYRAVRSSISIPLVFPPAAFEDAFMVDGGLKNNNPVDLAVESGADIVIDIDVGKFIVKEKSEIQSLGDVVGQTLGLVQGTRPLPEGLTSDNSFILAMDLTPFSAMEFSRALALINRGEEIAREKTNYAALVALAKKIEEGTESLAPRPLVKKDWRRQGAYYEIPEPVFSQAVLVSFDADGEREEDGEVARELPQAYIDAVFGKYYGKKASLSRLETDIDIFRRRGNYQNLGYHIAEIDGAQVLVLTGLRERQRKNNLTFSLKGHLLAGERLRSGFTPALDYAGHFSSSTLTASLEGDLSDVRGVAGGLRFAQHLGKWFTVFAGGSGGFYLTTVNAATPYDELLTYGYAAPAGGVGWRYGELASAELSYRYAPLWFRNKTAGGSYSGDLHSGIFEINFNSMNITQPLLAPFLRDTRWRAALEFPFAGSRWRAAFPWFERLEVAVAKAWVPRSTANIIASSRFSSYAGELESRFTLFSPVGKAGIPGYTSYKILERNEFLVGLKYLQEITPLSNKLNLRTFFAAEARGGSFWTPLESAREFGNSWVGGARLGLELATPVGIFFAGPEVSFDGKFAFSVYFN